MKTKELLQLLQGICYRNVGKISELSGVEVDEELLQDRIATAIEANMPKPEKPVTFPFPRN